MIFFDVRPAGEILQAFYHDIQLPYLLKGLPKSIDLGRPFLNGYSLQLYQKFFEDVYLHSESFNYIYLSMS